jgi:sugar phosphate isomerase/epimerase
MKILLSSGCLYTLPLERAFSMAAEAGYDGMEVIISEAFGGHEGYSLLRDLNEITSIYVLHAPFHVIPGWGDRITAVLKTIELAERLSVPMVNFHPPKWFHLEMEFWRWMYSVRDFQGELGGRKIAIAVENMPCRERILRFNPYILRQEKNLYLTFDCAHMGTTKVNFEGNFLRLYETKRIKNIHFSDYHNLREHLLPGHGILPLAGLLKFLKEFRYDEMITLEIIPEELAGDEAATRKALREMVLYIRRELT